MTEKPQIPAATQASVADDPAAPAAARLLENEQILENLATAIKTIERERKKVRPEDWATLFRQMQSVLQQLATLPFIRGDLHAEMLVDRVFSSVDLVDFDRRIDVLGEYIAGKLAYNAALAAIRAGKEPDPASLIPRKFGATSPGGARVVGQYGPSGSDFQVAGSAEPVQPRRGILRL